MIYVIRTVQYIRGRVRVEPQPAAGVPRSNGILNVLWRRLANRNVFFNFFVFTTAIDATDAMTSSGHVTSSVTAPFDSA